MKLPRVRFTVRRMMVAVAVVAMSLGAWLWIGQMKRRSAYFSALAGSYAREAANHSKLVSYYLDKVRADPGPDPGTGRRYYSDFQLVTSNHKVRLPLGSRGAGPQAYPRLIDPDPERFASTMRATSAREEVRAGFFSRLAAKYRRAASRPWVPLEADPPPPP